MAYNPNIPQSTDQLSQSQANLLGNFQAIQQLIDINHVDFSNGTNYGKHFFVEFPVQSPVPTTVGGEVGLYSQTSSLTSQPELVFARQAGSSAPSQVQITEFTSAGWARPGWAILPSGILLKWDSVSVSGNTSTVITFPTGSGIPVFNDVLNVQLTLGAPASGTPNQIVAATNVTTTQLTIYQKTLSGSAVNTTVLYLCLGY